MCSTLFADVHYGERMAAALARRGPLRRLVRLRQRLRAGQRLALPRLRRAFVQRRQAVTISSSREQIAGDEIDPDDPELLVATGFLRMGPWELTGMEVAKVARQRFLDDVTNSVGETFLAHSLQCARCHDHKFDPVPTRDYYSHPGGLRDDAARRASGRFCRRRTRPASRKNGISTAPRRSIERCCAELDEALSGQRREVVCRGGATTRLPGRRSKRPAGRGRAKRADSSKRPAILASRRRLRKRVPAQARRVSRRSSSAWSESHARDSNGSLGTRPLRPFALAVYSGRTPQREVVNAPVRMPAASARMRANSKDLHPDRRRPVLAGRAVRPACSASRRSAPAGLPPIPDTVGRRRRLWPVGRNPPDNPLTTRHRQSRLAVALRRGDRGQSQQLRLHRQAADASRAARLAGRHASSRRVGRSRRCTAKS
jgi:hypothetical protein